MTTELTQVESIFDLKDLKMKKIQTEIIVDASPDHIWQMLTDFTKYPNWNPFIKEINGRAHQGEHLKVRIHPPDGKAMSFAPQLIKVVPKRELRWLGHLWIKGLFDGEHYFKLIPLPDGQTKLIHGEAFRGLLSGLILSQIREKTRRGFIAMNHALKKACESKNQLSHA